MHDPEILRRTVGGLDFANPLVYGGGTCKTLADIKKACRSDIGGIELGTITKHAKAGNPGPNVFYAHVVRGVLIYTLNSLGLANPGKDSVNEWAREAIEHAHESGKRIGINVAGDTVIDILELVEWALKLRFDWITINGGCPNKYGASGQPLGVLCFDLNDVEHLMMMLDGEIGTGNGQLWWKPAMFSDTVNGLKRHAEMVACTDAITGYIANNTFGHCFAWGEDGLPAISPAGGLAGMGGPAVKPIAEGHLRMVGQILPERMLRIAAGGATYGTDIADFLRHKASLVHATSVVWANGMNYGEANRMLAELLEVPELPELLAA